MTPNAVRYYATCPHCGKRVAIRSDGRLAVHVPRPVVHSSANCIPNDPINWCDGANQLAPNAVVSNATP